MEETEQRQLLIRNWLRRPEAVEFANQIRYHIAWEQFQLSRLDRDDQGLEVAKLEDAQSRANIEKLVWLLDVLDLMLSPNDNKWDFIRVRVWVDEKQTEIRK